MADLIVGEITFSVEEQAAEAGKFLNEMRGKLLQAVVLQRLLDRKKIANKLTTSDMNADGMNRSQISSLRGSIEHMDAIHKELLAEVEKGK